MGFQKKQSALKSVQEKIRQGCTRCGFCTFFCPVYGETLDESFVARGKIALMRDVLEGDSLLEPGLLEHMDTCLLCRSCVVNCPTRVETDAVVRAAREEGVSRKGLPHVERILFRHILSKRKAFGRMLKAAGFLQPLLPGSKASGAIRHLPNVVSGMQAGRHVPRISSKFLKDLLPLRVLPPEGVERVARVAFFAGCGMEYIFPREAFNLVRFLARHGVEVVFPPDQGCCGLPVMARGDRNTAQKMALQNAAAFKGHGVVLTACATCGAAIREYGGTFENPPKTHGPLQAFSDSLVDLNRFLVDFLADTPFPLTARESYRGMKVTWHDPCHLVRYQGIREEPRRILNRICDITYVEMPHADRCCGMGGSFSIHHYDISRRIALRKADAIKSSGADLVVTACPGCITQINDALIQSHMPQRAVHIMDLFQ